MAPPRVQTAGFQTNMAHAIADVCTNIKLTFYLWPPRHTPQPAVLTGHSGIE